MATNRPKAADEVLKDIIALKEYTQLWRDERRDILESESNRRTFSQEYLQGWAASRRAYWTDSAESAARHAWQAAQRRVTRTEAELKRVSARKDANVDFARLSVLTNEYARELSRSPNPLTKDTPAIRLQRLAEQARQRGDTEALRALRTAAAPVIDSGGQELVAIRQDFLEDERAEFAEVTAAELEVQAAREGVDLVRNTILAVERDISGWQSAGIFSPLSPWQQSVLNESAEGLGRIIDKSEAVAVGGGAV